MDGDIREIVVAKIWSNLTFREIAELTEWPISSVHLDYQRWIERLRKLLERRLYRNPSGGSSVTLRTAVIQTEFVGTAQFIAATKWF